MIVRDAQADDIATLAGIAHENYREVFASLLPACDWAPFDHAHFARRLGAAVDRLRVVGMTPLGFALVSSGHVDMFFIDRAAQGRGAGRALLADLVSRGARSLETFALNQPARRFYEQAGWQAVDVDRRVFAGTECDFMRYERR